MGVPKRLTEMQKRFAELLVFVGPDGPLSKSDPVGFVKIAYYHLYCDRCGCSARTQSRQYAVCLYLNGSSSSLCSEGHRAQPQQVSLRCAAFAHATQRRRDATYCASDIREP